ncbi:unnamed protein product [Paramecium sonneborni]|uniref:Uncharacterized protein n=1 Tax=Paramecium sonneborni TaxID=65129 RepID=A0A8S1RRE1_9CILI|nr:unnamed protein product [Paramecium sonneborni]
MVLVNQLEIIAIYPITLTYLCFSFRNQNKCIQIILLLQIYQYFRSILQFLKHLPRIYNDVQGYYQGICEKVVNAGYLSSKRTRSINNWDSTFSDAVYESLKVVDDDNKFCYGVRVLRAVHNYKQCLFSNDCVSVASAANQQEYDSNLTVTGCYYNTGKCNSAVSI